MLYRALKDCKGISNNAIRKRSRVWGFKVPWCQATVIRYWHGLPRDELCHILDLKDGYGPNSPGETFRVLKEKEEKECGEYRTRCLVLEAWDINKPSLPWVLLINKA